MDSEPLHCPVCAVEIDNIEEAHRLINCRHPYHLECIKIWLQTGKYTCPVCRIESKTILKWTTNEVAYEQQANVHNGDNIEDDGYEEELFSDFEDEEDFEFVCNECHNEDDEELFSCENCDYTAHFTCANIPIENTATCPRCGSVGNNAQNFNFAPLATEARMDVAVPPRQQISQQRTLLQQISNLQRKFALHAISMDTNVSKLMRTLGHISQVWMDMNNREVYKFLVSSGLVPLISEYLSLIDEGTAPTIPTMSITKSLQLLERLSVPQSVIQDHHLPQRVIQIFPYFPPQSSVGIAIRNVLSKWMMSPTTLDAEEEAKAVEPLVSTKFTRFTTTQDSLIMKPYGQNEIKLPLYFASIIPSKKKSK